MAALDQVSRLPHTELHAVCLHLLVVHFELFEALENLGRHLSSGELTHAMEAIVAQNRHDSGNNLTFDPSETAISHPVVENLIVEEELRDDEVCASVDLLFEIADIVLA